MKKDASISSFLNGPLSDEKGGSQTIRTEAERTFKETHSNTDDTKIVPKNRKFILGRPKTHLFSYQQEISDELDKWISGDNRHLATLVSLPTGGGKTRVGTSFLINNFEKKSFSRMLWVAPSTELVEQAVSTFETLWHTLSLTSEISISVNEIPRITKQFDGQCSFVTAQLATKRIQAIESYDPEVLVFDEAHQAVAQTFRKIIDTQNKLGRKSLGLSATPGRAVDNEGHELSSLFSNKLITSRELGDDPVDELRRKGVLAKLQMQQIDLPKQWDQIRVKTLDSRAMSIDELAIHPHRFWSTVETIKSLPKGSRTLVFGASIAHCYSLMAALRNAGIKAETISHNTSSQTRQKILTRFGSGDIDVLLNKSLLATGYDCPGITDVVLASPIRSPILWEQILGRASRGPAVGGTRVGRIWELDDHRKMHGQVMSYLRFLNDLWK